MAKYLDSNGLTYFWGKLKTLLSNKVDKVSGKGLSTNDYTSDEKTKLSGIEIGANKTTVTNSLTSASTTDALSAAQGKELKTLVDGKAAATSVQGTLTASGWTANGDVFMQTLSNDTITGAGDIIVSPAPESLVDYGAATVRATAHASGNVTFSATTKPTSELVVNIIELA